MAIAFDAATDGGIGAGASPYTFNHTCTGTDRLLFVSILGIPTTDSITGVTYNGVAMTRISTGQIPTVNYRGYLYYLKNPASGSHQVSVAFDTAAGDSYEAMAVSYTGCDQTTQPDANNSATASSAGGITANVTTVANNAWTVMLTLNHVGLATASTGSTQRLNAGGMGVFDSNGPLSPAGSQSMAVTGSTAHWLALIASMTPIAGPLTAGTASVSATAFTTATVTSSAHGGGVGAVSRQWKRSAVSGSGYSNVSGATSLTLNDTGLSPNSDYYYILTWTDDNGSVDSNEIHVATLYGQVVCDGDSITSGLGLSAGNKYPAQLATLLGSRWSVANVGVAGHTLADRAAAAAADVDPLLDTGAVRSIVAIFAGTNDDYFNASAATIESRLQGYSDDRLAAGWDRLIVFTFLPRNDFPGTSTISPGDPETVHESIRQTFNTWLRANYRTLSLPTQLADVGGNANLGDKGDEANGTYYQDGVHPTTAGAAIIAAAVKNAITGSGSTAATLLAIGVI